MGFTVPRVIDDSNLLKIQRKNSLDIPENERSDLPGKEVVLKFFRTGDDGYFHRIDATFVSGVKWCIRNSSPVTIRNRKSAYHHALFHVCRGQFSGHPSC
ncbi:hypothetical protein TNCV_416721 [Trichonephila clavipes]|nr:hypothetical protein TNCV_416721 [Trichonephila clavipes]